MTLAERIFPFIEDAATTVRSPDEWNRLYKQALADLVSIGSFVRSGSALDEFSATGLALVGYPRAKARLIENGMDRARVEQMAVGQVIAIYTEQVCRQLSDEHEKLWYVPFWESRARSEAVEQKLAAAHPMTGGVDREVLPIMSLLLPAILAVRESEIRMARELDSLRVIEALRIYAANHDGQLPASLSDVTEVPIPLNPATGQPFAYKLEGATAILELPASDGIRNQNRRYEITVQQD
jgi:hypothetical protein